MSGDEALLATLRESQRLGYLGRRPVDEVLAHARVFVRVLVDELATPELTVVDLGAGGGVPGLVIAHDLPQARITLVDRRTQRTDFLARMVHRHRWSDRVRVVADDARRLAEEEPCAYAAVVARGFGPPDMTLELASRFLNASGRIVLSEPPAGDRWDPTTLARLGLTHAYRPDRAGRVAVFRRLDEDD